MQRLDGHLGKGDVFSVLAPGLYLSFVFYACAVASAETPQSLGTIFQGLLATLQENPLSLLVVTLLAYLVGSLARAVPVSFAEKTIPPFRSDFPYPAILDEVLEDLDHSCPGIRKRFPPLTGIHWKPLNNMFNYWKSVVCARSELAFDHYRGFEIRVRFFAGVIWAAWVGIGGSLYIALRQEALWGTSALHLGVISVLVLVLLGGRIRRVRKQEARILLITYIALQEGCEDPPIPAVAGDPGGDGTTGTAD